VISGRSVISKRTIISSNGSVKSSKTYISHLENQLKEEKSEREKLTKEIEEIKRINSAISSKLGLSTTVKC
jgi:predicted RNase H-like nuclease (RuvC/YqgF family)